MALKFSVPYQGSKQGIAKEIFDVIESREGQKKYFYDLCGGGGAMSFLANHKGYEVVYNEINEDIAQFIDFIISNKEKSEYGAFPKEFYNFVDRETFVKIRDSKIISPYNTFVLLTYSFGNAKTTYFCNAYKEIYKKEGHKLVVFLDYDNFVNYKEKYKKQIHILDAMYEKIKGLASWRDRRKVFANIILKLEAIRVAELEEEYKNYTFEEFHKMQNKNIVNKINELRPNIEKKKYKSVKSERLEQLGQLEQLQQLQRLQQLEQLARLERLKQVLNG